MEPREYKIIRSYSLSPREAAWPDFKAMREAAVVRAAEVLSSQGLGLKLDNNSIAVRDTLPFTDLALNGRASTNESRDQWALPAITEGTMLAWINQTAFANNRVVAIYGAWYDSANPAVSVLRFEKGSGPMFELQIEKLYVEQDPVVLMPQLAVYRPSETIVVRAIPRITAVLGERLGLFAVTAEPAKNRVNGSDLN